MKKNLKKTTAAILSALLLTLPLVSCAEAEENQTSTDKPQYQQSTEGSQKPTNDSSPSQPSDKETDQGTSQGNDINTDSYKEQITYYMELTETLQAELLKLKEDNYIEECEYQLKISTLEDTIETLKKTIASLTSASAPSPDTQKPSNDQLAAKSDYEYVINDGSVTITRYVGKEIDVNIPSSIDGVPVTRIGEEAFKSSQIRSVTIPSGVREIDWFAFAGCTVLESITIPSSIIAVGYGAFDYCPRNLTVKCEKGSYIEAYALSWGMKVEAK